MLFLKIYLKNQFAKSNNTTSFFFHLVNLNEAYKGEPQGHTYTKSLKVLSS